MHLPEFHSGRSSNDTTANLMSVSERPAHGGRLIAASRLYGIPVEQWLDLSTGVSPVSWPVPSLPEAVWRDLPQDDDRLVEQASLYYGCSSEQLLPVPGSQFAIEVLPQILAQYDQPQKVALPYWGYHEHYYHWLRAGHEPVIYHSSDELEQLVVEGKVAHAVVINPNNPSAEQLDKRSLLTLARLLSQRGGVLLADEAFMDATPERSLCGLGVEDWPQGLVVLRSVGKFFGLAGIRLGFVMAAEWIQALLCERLAPWAVSHPARWVGQQALADKAWQQSQRAFLADASTTHLQLLRQQLPQFKWVANGLFASGFGGREACASIYTALARQGVLVRELSPMSLGSGLYESGLPGLECPGSVPEEFSGGIRVGLPSPANQERLLTALQAISHGLVSVSDTTAGSNGKEAKSKKLRELT